MSIKKLIPVTLGIATFIFGGFTAFAKDIPDYYKEILKEKEERNFSFPGMELPSNYNKGYLDTYTTKTKSGEKLTLYYVADGTGIIENNKLVKSGVSKLSTPSGEELTLEEIREHFENKLTNELPTVPMITEEVVINNIENKTLEELINMPLDEYEVSEFELEIVRLTNEERAKIGLKPLVLNKEVSKVARIKAQEMLDLSYFDHGSPIYGSPTDMVRDITGNKKYRIGENIGGARETPEKQMNGWMNSKGHKNNILDTQYNYIEIGVGFAEIGTRKIWVQMFVAGK